MESDVNFVPVFGLAERPIIEGVRITLSVEGERLAAQRCPGVFCMANAVPFEIRLEYGGGFD